jgi:type IV secretion system protein VirD4
MTPTSFLVGQVLVVFAIVIGGLWFSTERVAAALGYQPRLRLPWFEILSLSVYCPWRFFEWWYAFDAYAPTPLNKAGVTAASSGVAGIVVNVIGSLCQARQSRLATTYGSFRWASQSELEAARQFRPAGIFLGQLKDRDLRHDGPEHVMAFAPDPKRHGRGLDLVVAHKMDAYVEAARAFMRLLPGRSKIKTRGTRAGVGAAISRAHLAMH